MEFLVSCLFLIGFSCILWKWSKSILVIILLEFSSTLLMGSLILFPSSMGILMVLCFLFFVSEALVLLASLYSTIRISGMNNSVVLFS